MKVKISPLDITEKDFGRQIRDLAKMFGWKYHHTWLSIHSPAGFPDVVMVRPPRLIFAELKGEKGKVSPTQEEWLDILKACHRSGFDGFDPWLIPEVYLWRPHMFEKIVEILR